MKRNWSVFTKPWKTHSPQELGELVSRLGFNGVEFPLRPGFQVGPEDCERELPRLQERLRAYGVSITSVASVTEERVFAACQAAEVRILRIMAPADPALGYRRSMEELKARLHGLEPLAARYGVTVGVQNHYGFGVSSTMELAQLLEGFDPNHVAAVWDAAHSALAGELPEQALDIIWDKLCLVNLKTAFYQRVNGPEAPEAVFKPYFTTGRHGASSWSAIAKVLRERGYEGDICMPAEYTDTAGVERYILEDAAYAKGLMGE